MKKRRKAAREEQGTLAQAAPDGDEELSLWRDPLVHVLLVLVVGLAAYSNIIWAPFVFDDVPFLAGNPLIKDFGFFADPQRVFELPINPDLKHNFVLRPVAYFTFALNHALHGLDVGGYHVVNLLLHLADALLVYLLLWLTLRTPVLRSDGDGDQPAQRYYYLPFVSSLLFVCHPLQTQAVTYVIQRFVPLVALFYIGALVLYAAGRLAAGKGARTACYLGAFFACVLAMKTKENAFTLPVVILLYEVVFFRGAVTARRVLSLAPFVLTMAIIPVKLMQLSAMSATTAGAKVAGAVNLINFKQISSWEYLMTQFGVIATYLRLLFIPVGQNFDYDYPLQQTLLAPAVLLPLALLVGLAGGGAWLLFRTRGRRGMACAPLALAGFGIWWFFITLSVESSVVPIDDLIFEHRAYLPSVGFFIAVVTGAFSLLPLREGEPLGTSRLAIAAFALLVTVSAAAAYARNSVWETPVSLWRDNVRKSPGKPRSHFSLGVALADTLPPWHTDDINVMLQPMNARQNEVLAELVREFKTAIRLDPQSGAAYTFLGGALLVQKRFAEASDALARAAALEPRDARPPAFMGQVLEAQGDLAGARRKYLEAIAVDPSAQYAHLFLARLCVRERRHAEALAGYETAYSLSPRPDLEPEIARLRQVVGVR
ncbi:tetratricopeptide repeat protein [Geomonas propionica]|uniref:Tetratricopeptide repeat protein n=1 Tax=Geomonas propionica TaxID=2798582 RepID=A0ABS0YR64_9BACT|nr:tetratricopeptide repeat protein [Geomonas propionica]MBJ6800461.1 tetratricopeptide repeat protein [Geomonas propionica]